MNKEAIDHIIETNPKLKGARHALELMQPGAYCIHRSWGFGQIKDYDEANNKLIIDFKDGKEGHPMDPAFCVGKLHILDETDLLVRQQLEPDTIADMIKSQPVEVVIEVLSKDPKGSVSATELEGYLTRLIGPTKYKKWWTSTRKLLVKDPRVAVPVKKTDPFVLRDEPLSPEQEILEEFYANKKPKQKILLAEKLYQLSGSVEEIDNDLPQILEDLTDALKNARQLSQAERLHGVWVRNDLCRHLCEDVETLEPTSTSILEACPDLSELAEELPGAYQKRFLDLISRAFADKWESVVIDLLKNSTGKFTSECIGFLMERECTDLIVECFNKSLAEQTFKAPVLHWIVKNRQTRRFNRIVKDLISPRLLGAILQAVDNIAIQSTSNRRILLGDILSEDSGLIPDLLEEASLEEARDMAHALLMNQGFGDLTKKSLLARFIKRYPEIQSVVSGKEQAVEAEDQLVVSQQSMNERKEEYEDLINVKIPENKEAISIARDHGDLKENSEYKMARQDQDVLMARKALLESEMSKARVTDFTDATADAVSVGSVVTIKNQNTGNSDTYAILGAWDSKPEDNIVSYKTPLGQSLLSKKSGEQVTTEIDGHEEIWVIERIERWVDRQPTA